MAFISKAQYGDPIGTVKDNERIVVQLVEVTGRTNGQPGQLRVDVRIHAKSDTYDGPTKVGFAFTDPEDIQDLIDTLAFAKDEAIKAGMSSAPAPAVPAAAPAVVVVPIRRKVVRAKSAPAKTSAKAPAKS